MKARRREIDRGLDLLTQRAAETRRKTIPAGVALIIATLVVAWSVRRFRRRARVSIARQQIAPVCRFTGAVAS